MGQARRHRWLLAAAAAYGLVVFAVGFWPNPVDRPIGRLLSSAIRLLHRLGVPSFIDYRFVEFSANVVFFVPVGALLASLLAPRWLALPVAVGASMVIEVGQLLLRPERVASIADVAANTIGALVGIGVIEIIRAARQRGAGQRGAGAA